VREGIVANRAWEAPASLSIDSPIDRDGKSAGAPKKEIDSK